METYLERTSREQAEAEEAERKRRLHWMRLRATNPELYDKLHKKYESKWDRNRKKAKEGNAVEERRKANFLGLVGPRSGKSMKNWSFNHPEY